MRALALALVVACHHDTPAPRNEPPPPVPTAPAKRREVVTETKVEMLDPIRFVGQTSQIELASLPTLDAVASTLAGNPSILLVEVQAFGSDGAAEFRQQLGDARANAVVAELVKRKVEPGRLRARGVPEAPGGTRTQVAFEIVARR